MEKKIIAVDVTNATKELTGGTSANLIKLMQEKLGDDYVVVATVGHTYIVE